MAKYLPRPQKKRGNNGSDHLRIVHDSKQNVSSLSRGRVHGQKFLKTTIYNKKMNYDEITMNLFPHKLNEIAGIIDEVVRAVVTDAPQIKRICFETGYGKPKKAIDIRKAASSYLTRNLQYTCDKSGAPKTFKFLSDNANRIVIFPQDYIDFVREQQEKQEEEDAIVSAKNAKKEAKERKRRQKHFVHNKWKKNLKYPEPKKKRIAYVDEDAENGNVGNGKYFTPGGDEGDDNLNRGNVQLLDMQIGDDIDDENDARNDENDHGNSSAEVEETEETFLRNFANLQVMLQESNEKQKQQTGKRKKRFRKNDDVDIFEGVKNQSQKFEYEAPDAWRYKSKPLPAEHKSDDQVRKNPMMKTQTKKLKSGEWECEFCTFLNQKQDEICGMCFMESFELRSRQFLSTVKANNKLNEQTENTTQKNSKNAEHDNRPKWTCAACTFINTGGDGEDEDEEDACAVCGTVNEQREQYLNAKYEDYGSGFFQDAPLPPVPVIKTAEQLRDEETEELEKHFHTVKRVAANQSNSKKNPKTKSKSKKSMATNQTQQSPQHLPSSRNFPGNNNNNNNNNGNGSFDFLSMSEAVSLPVAPIAMDHGLNSQIADINREFQATVWKAHQDKQKRIAMIQRNNGVGSSSSPKQKQKQKQKRKSQNPNFGFQPHQSQSQTTTTTKNQIGIKQSKNQSNKKTNANAKKKNGKQSTMQSAQSGTIKFEWIHKLTDMGFAYEKVMDALAATNSVGYNQTLDYLIQHT